MANGEHSIIFKRLLFAESTFTVVAVMNDDEQIVVRVRIHMLSHVHVHHGNDNRSVMMMMIMIMMMGGQGECFAVSSADHFTLSH